MVEPVPHPRGRRVLLLTPTFVPDPASVGQYMADVAFELARRGHEVHVFTARNGYDDPTHVYPARERLNGVYVRRFPASSFGKASMLRRLFGTFAFMAQCIVHGLFTRNLGGLIITTSPPLSDLAGVILATLRRLPVVYWGMDLYVAQMLALDKFKREGLAAKLLNASQRFILRRCTLVVALDRFMAQRLSGWDVPASRLLVLPPWPHEEHIRQPTGPAGAAARPSNPFRLQHGLGDDFVIMYSGNHTPSNPLTTLLEAAVRLRDEPGLRFLFVGGGHGKREVAAYMRERGMRNALSLPYQPITELKHSLTAADVQVVSLGAGMTGIIHPSKVYGAMAAGRPILYLGPSPSHISELLDAHHIGLRVSHGDVDGAVAAIRQLRDTPPAVLAETGATAKRVLDASLSQHALCGQLCDRVEQAFDLPKAAETAR